MRSPTSSLPRCVSDRPHYGHLVAVRSEAVSFEPLERSVLESYARLAATALDSEAAISVPVARHAAQALLNLSSSLADLASTEEMVLRLAQRYRRSSTAIGSPSGSPN